MLWWYGLNTAVLQSTDLYQELISPVVQVLKGLLGVHIIDQHAAVCTSVEGHTKTLKPLLPCCVPDLCARQSSL